MQVPKICNHCGKAFITQTNHLEYLISIEDFYILELGLFLITFNRA